MPGFLTHKYVDDTTIFEILNSVKSSSHISNFLHSTNLWALKNDIKINTNKTKELVISPRGQDNHTPLETDQGTIECVHEFKHLGIHPDSTLTWTKHIEYITKSQPNNYRYISQKSQASWTTYGLGPPSTLLHRSHPYSLEYCSCISTKLSSQIENIKQTSDQNYF